MERIKGPNFFILGAPKCGTTSLAAWLSEHPRVYMSPVKEPHFFATDLRSVYKPRDLSSYLDLFSDADRFQVAVGEASTGYLYSRTAVPNILQSIADPRFIVMLRRPIEMAPALHSERLYWRQEHITDFSEAWQLQDLRSRGEGVTPLCRDPRLLLYGPICCLGEQLERLYRQVTRERVCVVILDDVKESPRREYLRVLNFLGVPDDGRMSFPVYNRAKERRFGRVATLIQVLGRVRSYLSGPRYRGFGLLNRMSRWNTRPTQESAIGPDMECELKRYFATDVAKLGQLLGRDLSHWL